MERIHHEQYRCAGHNFFIETYRDADRISMHVHDISPEGYLERTPIGQQYLTQESTLVMILKSTVFAEALVGVKDRIRKYIHDGSR